VRRILLVALSLFTPGAMLATDRDNAEVGFRVSLDSASSRGRCAWVGFSKRRYILEIEFPNGAIYRYIDAPPSVYRDLLSVHAKARYYDLNIKRNYQSIRVQPRVKDQPNN
jgi:hypothetical protein